MKIKLTKIDYLLIGIVSVLYIMNGIVIDNFCSNDKNIEYYYLYKDRINICYLNEFGFYFVEISYWVAVVIGAFFSIKYCIYYLSIIIKWFKDINKRIE